MYRSHVLDCGGTGCTSSNSLKIIERFEELIEKNGLGERLIKRIVTTGGQTVDVLDGAVFVNGEKLEELIARIAAMMMG